MATSTLRFLRNYNNYSNRIIKHDVALSDYSSYDYWDLPNTNFVENDGIRTEHVINTTVPWKPDYVLELDNEKTNIISRWFVIKMDRTRLNQYVAYLKRDTLADKYDKVLSSPAIIERAIISDVNNPLLYNSEGWSFNQIKKQEILLRDATRSAWYVLYFKKGLASKTISFTPGESIEDHTISTTIEQSIFGTNGYLYQTSNIVPMITYQTDGGNLGSWCYRLAVYPNKDETYEVTANDPIWFNQSLRTVKSELTVFNGTYNTLRQNVLDDNTFIQITQQQEQYLEWDNQVVKDSNNKLYRVHITKNPYSRWKYVTTGNMVNTMKNLINSTSLTRSGDWGDNAFAVKYDNIEYSFSYEEIDDPNALSITIDWASKAQTLHSDYNILAIPYNTIGIRPLQNINTVPEDWSNMLLHAIMGAYTGETELVDIQVLPYFPIPNKATLPITTSASEEVFTIANDGRAIVIYYVKDANFSFNLSYSLSAESNYIDRKTQQETQKVQLVSPNYQGIFEFSVAKNNGVDYFNVDVSLKPYNPYIHINPNFKGLYGQDFDDARGLICGGDFSIPIWSTAWQQYELNNKNYQRIFDRQMQSLDITQSQERTLAGWQIATGSIQGSVQGATAAGIVGGPYAAIAGAVVGGVSSLAGGIADYSMLDEKQAEQKNLATDMFKYQLGNIKALPYSLNKVTPLTYNNKLFPFIEIYEATDEEINMFKYYLAYQSMAVDAIGFVSDYIQSEKTFIKGRIIRVEDTDLTSYEVEDMYNELEKGVYI